MESLQQPGIILNEELVRRHSSERSLYATPELNESLFVHHLSISRIGDISGYINVTTLCIESNKLRNLNGLSQMPNLKYLNVNFNLIETLDFSDNVFNNPRLQEFHALGNSITTILPPEGDILSLKMLKINKNRLTDLVDLSFLPSLEVLDISSNHFSLSTETATAEFEDFLSQKLSRSVKQLYVSPNDFVGSVRHFRARTIVACPQLIYLDKCSVSAEERELAVAELSQDSNSIRAVREAHKLKSVKEMDDRIKNLREFQKTYSEVDQLRRELLSFVNHSLSC